MHSRILVVCAAALTLASAGCAAHRPAAHAAAGRSAEEIRAGFAAERLRTPHIPMLSEEAAHKALPGLFKKGPMPTLCRVGALQPRTMEAVLAEAKAMRREGDLDAELLNDVFWAVSSSNDCFY